MLTVSHADQHASDLDSPSTTATTGSDARRPSLLSIISGLGWPVFLGLGATILFFVLIHRGPLNHPLMHRYFASHPVTYCETALFFIGIAALVMKAAEVVGQYWAFGRVALRPVATGGDSVRDCPELLSQVAGLPAGVRGSYLARRLNDALEMVRRTGSADQLADELKYLADVEAAAQQESYSLVRIVIWATPMLGFLGTVMGITEALGDLSKNAELLATSIDTAIQGLLGGLYVAFDTTALALTLSMLLMFIQFVIDRVEQQLLSSVDRAANQQLMGRFPTVVTSSDPQLAMVERLMHVIARGAEQLTHRQAEIWQGSLKAAEQQWQTMFQTARQQLTTSLADHHDQWERSCHVLTQAVQATSEVAGLERALNSNLAALASTKNFEDMVLSLTAAIHLLTTRLSTSSETISFTERARRVSTAASALSVTAPDAGSRDEVVAASGAAASAAAATEEVAGREATARRSRLTTEELRALRGKAA